ncbi:DUF1659 domain-containing protein [Alteribacillus sp. HJP-4]|uniref:DUF1659 domain-containing protein n=1 Tax=Alteribacillus sp. HJP-4 TaxID=2775394 RepID=UPI0035CD18A1
MGELIASRLSLQLETGVDGSGKPMFKQRSFNNIKITAEDDKLKEVADALSGLQQYNTVAVRRHNEYDLV